MKTYFVYILSNNRNGTLYIGITSNLAKRVLQHKEKSIKGFTSKYDVEKLIYYEQYEDVKIAICREKRLKEWPRKWKIRLIEKHNPYWNDLYKDIWW